MKQIILAATLLGAMFIGTAAEAQTYTPRVNKHQRHQNARIKHGVKNGELTRHETRNLKKQQAKIRNYKQMAKADGRVTKSERVMINRAQHDANRNIYRKKHNNRTRM